MNLQVPSHKLYVLICIIKPWKINHANLNKKEFSSALAIYIRVSLYRLYTPMGESQGISRHNYVNDMNRKMT